MITLAIIYVVSIMTMIYSYTTAPEINYTTAPEINNEE